MTGRGRRFLPLPRGLGAQPQSCSQVLLGAAGQGSSGPDGSPVWARHHLSLNVCSGLCSGPTSGEGRPGLPGSVCSNAGKPPANGAFSSREQARREEMRLRTGLGPGGGRRPSHQEHDPQAGLPGGVWVLSRDGGGGAVFPELPSHATLEGCERAGEEGFPPASSEKMDVAPVWGRGQSPQVCG